MVPPTSANELLFGKVINPKRRWNRRVSVGIVLMRHFVGFQQGSDFQLLLWLCAICLLSLPSSDSIVSTLSIVAVGDSSVLSGRPRWTLVIRDKQRNYRASGSVRILKV
jgi:hypothetical protein